MLTLAQAKQMLQMQDRMNAVVNPDWLTAGYAWHRAILGEAWEAIEHHGWKWWKRQTPDLPQLRMELVDIWHFAMSGMLVRWQGDHEAAAEFICRERTDTHVMFAGGAVELAPLDLIGKLELMIGLAVGGTFSMALFCKTLEGAGMSWADLYALYIGKNTLNLFRQANGYKEGTYRKVWAGREDNEHLHELLGTTILCDENLPAALMAALETRYRETAAA